MRRRALPPALLIPAGIAEADEALLAVLRGLGHARLEALQRKAERSYGAHDLVRVLQEARRWAVARGVAPARPGGRI